MLVDKAYYGIKYGMNDPWGLCGTPENSVCVIDPQAWKSSLTDFNMTASHRYHSVQISQCFGDREKSVSCFNTRLDNLINLNFILLSCEGRRICAIKATNNIFGDPCPGLLKYLSYEWSCAIASTFRVIRCEAPGGQL